MKKLSLIILPLLVVFLLIGLGVIGKLYWDADKRLKAIESGGVTQVSPDDPKLVVERVGKHLLLPKEEPQVVTVTNVEILKREQPFFTLAQNGDKLLVYASKVVLYRPTEDKVVDVAALRITPMPEASPSGIPRTDLPTVTSTPSAN